MPLASSGAISAADVVSYLSSNSMWEGGSISLNDGGIRHIAYSGYPGASSSGTTISYSDLYGGRFGCAPGVYGGNNGAGLYTRNANDTVFGDGTGGNSVYLTAQWDTIAAVYSIKWLWTYPGSGGESVVQNVSGGTTGTIGLSTNLVNGNGYYVFRTEAYGGSNATGTLLGTSGPGLEFCRQVNYVNNTTANGISLSGGGPIENGTEVTVYAVAGPSGSPLITMHSSDGGADTTGYGTASITRSIYGDVTITASASGYGSRSVTYNGYDP